MAKPPAKPSGEMNGPYPSVDAACVALAKACAGGSEPACTCAPMPVTAAPAKGAILEVRVLRATNDTTQVAAPALRTSAGWWVDSAPPTMQGVFGGMESTSSLRFEAAKVVFLAWKGHEGGYFRVSGNVYRRKKWAPGPETFSNTVTYDVACAATTSAPICAHAELTDPPPAMGKGIGEQALP